MRWIPFSKYSGCGNDFVLVDDRSSIFPSHHPTLIQLLCDRRQGIGADGLILLQHSAKADYRMRIFNCDGSEAEMCGNGIRCLMHFIAKIQPEVTKCLVETAERVILLKLHGSSVDAAVGDPSHVEWNLPIAAQLGADSVHFLNTGVPHCVVFVPDCDVIDLSRIGPQLRHHPLFGPKGTNVNLATISPQGCRYRTWERGVEGETPACGTGAVAVALAAAHIAGLKSPINVRTSSQEWLEIGFKQCGQSFSNITMTGPATHIFDGTWKFSLSFVSAIPYARATEAVH